MRTWRPYITDHAVARYLERALRVPTLGPTGAPGKCDDMLARAELTKRAVLEMMWPEHMLLERDPGGIFALKQGKFRLVVREGTLRTVLYGAWLYTTNGFVSANQVMAEEL